MAAYAGDIEIQVENLRDSLKSLTGYHCILLDICLKKTKIEPVDNTVNYDALTHGDLHKLANMAQVELLAGMEKCLEGSEESSESPEPHPFDIFLMTETMRSVMNKSTSRSKPLSLCLPDRGQLKWYDGLLHLTSLTEQEPKWRVASLSGAARILSALLKPVGGLKDLAMKREGLVQAVTITVQDEDMVLGKLNYSQRQAVATLLSPTFRYGFFAIQGPPGCGKTTTCVEMILAALKNRRHEKETIVVCAPSNAAVANAALKYWERHQSLLDVVVFGENCDESVQFLNPLYRGGYFDKIYEKFQKACTECPAKVDRLKNALVEDLVSWLHLPDDQDWTLTELTHFCPYIEMESKQGRAYYAGLLRESNVLLSTLNSLGSNMLRNNLNASTIFFDEAGQSPEAEFYIAATFPGVERMIVMGDPMQLPATVIDQECRAAGYGRSFLQNIFQLHKDKVHLLDTQYRMDPDILRFPNDAFYQGKISSGDNVLGRTPLVENPFLFINTNGKGTEQKKEFSWLNTYEGNLIKSMIFDDKDIARLIKESVQPVRIIIITPYRAQAQLLKNLLGAKYRNSRIEIATVDSFQGQEADIVILSTVRTKRTGFIDNAQRLNVALTRAKRILRVVGDANFFDSLGKGSILKKLTKCAVQRKQCEESKLKSLAWCPPNWKQVMPWKPVWTSRFQQCINQMTSKDQNIALNTLLAVASGDESALSGFLSRRARPGFYVSALKEYVNEVRIVWIAKRGSPPIIEAIFAGTYAQCRNFIQRQKSHPVDACIVEPGLNGIASTPEAAEEADSDSDVWVAWAVNNMHQQVVLEGGELPSGSLALDSEQEEVARSPSPLMIESRSGTGKTLVLLQHAAYYADHNDQRPSCFITVSQRLRNVLEEQYREMNSASNMSLKTTFFFSFSNFLHALLQQKSIVDFDEMHPCTYLGYEQVKKSHKKNEVEPHLIESEIGGVIVGSLAAAVKRAPLSRQEYFYDIRSNVGRSFQQDLRTREYIYDKYEEYSKWKREEGLFDVGDVVMRLLQEEWEQCFCATYIDEVQDLTYAAIYLVCSIAGKDNLQWVCAGDPAQMISPGCSFHFDGLKQTFLSVRPGIESKLTNVFQLLVNYRTTEDVLILANKVLDFARRQYPSSIPFARKEMAKKNLGLRIILCSWKVAIAEKVELGTNQAFVYSSSNPESLEEKAQSWLGSHPFIMSTLDSKGLEFDDVIVAFDFERKVWNVDVRSVASLRMLRELYVAITRAKRRVVVLLKNGEVEMEKFFESLGCDFQQAGAELVLREFKSVTKADDWIKRAKDLFQSENYSMAAKCFDHAKDTAWYHFALGKACQSQGNLKQASDEFRAAIAIFGERKDFDRVIELGLTMSDLLKATQLTLDEACIALINQALDRRDDSLPRSQAVRLALIGNSWNKVTLDDLLDPTLANIFIPFRTDKRMKEKFASVAMPANLQALEKALPLFTADYHLAQSKYADAVRVFLSCRNERQAVEATDRSIKATKSCGGRTSQLALVASEWIEAGVPKTDAKITTLVKLFMSTLQAASEIAHDCIFLLGKEVVLFFVDHDGAVDRRLLHSFSKKDFFLEVTDYLTRMFNGDHFKVVQWYLQEQDINSALDHTRRRLNHWKDQELLELACFFLRRLPGWFFEHLDKQNLLYPVALELLALSSQRLSRMDKLEFLQSISIYLERLAEDHKKEDLNLRKSTDLVLSKSIDWFIEKLVPTRKPQQNQKNLIDQLSATILNLWPAAEKGAKTSAKILRRDKFVFSERICKGLLASILDAAANAAERDCILDISVQRNTANKASSSLLELSLKYQRVDLCIIITHGIVKSRNMVKSRRAKIFQVWINYLEETQDGCPWSDSHSEDIVDSLLELSSTLGCVDTLLTAFIRNDNFTGSFLLTKKVIYSRDTEQITSVLRAWATYDWTLTNRGEHDKGLLPTDQSTDLLFLLFCICRIPRNRWLKSPEWTSLRMFGPRVASCLFRFTNEIIDEHAVYQRCRTLEKVLDEICIRRGSPRQPAKANLQQMSRVSRDMPHSVGVGASIGPVSCSLQTTKNQQSQNSFPPKEGIKPTHSATAYERLSHPLSAPTQNQEATPQANTGNRRRNKKKNKKKKKR